MAAKTSAQTNWRGNCAPALFVVLFLSAAFPVDGQDAKHAASDETATAWKQVGSQDGVAISSRSHAEATLEEFRAVGEIDAAPAAVFAIVNNPEEYPRFMPYTSECRVLHRFDHGIVAYQRLDLPLVSDRDYTLRSVYSKTAGPAGATYRIHWEQANDLGPAPRPGVTRVKFCQGSWVIEPGTTGKSRVTYTVCSGAVESLPAFVAEAGSKLAIHKIFEAIRKEAREPKSTGVKG
jgi:hypothetical protein